MKLGIVSDVIGTVLKIMGLLLLVPGFVSAYYHETSGISAFALTSLLSIGTGIILSRLGTKGDVGNKEAFAAVSLGWLRFLQSRTPKGTISSIPPWPIIVSAPPS
jgi:trk system potassium uptake protein TrkH